MLVTGSRSLLMLLSLSHIDLVTVPSQDRVRIASAPDKSSSAIGVILTTPGIRGSVRCRNADFNIDLGSMARPCILERGRHGSTKARALHGRSRTRKGILTSLPEIAGDQRYSRLVTLALGDWLHHPLQENFKLARWAELSGDPLQLALQRLGLRISQHVGE
jgi:hypothetical protein